MSIYLYIKQHRKTKLKYFGKTTNHEIERYKGSGKYWLRHIKKHGIKKVDTLCIWIFEDNEEKECNKFALKFSIENDIINSSSWANLITEDGIGGLGRKWTKEEKNLRSINISGSKNPMFGRKRPDTVERNKTQMKGFIHTDEWKEERSKKYSGEGNPMFGKKRPDLAERNRKKISL